MDDFPDVEYLNVLECIPRIKTFSAPNVNKLNYYGNRSDRIPFTFYKNIKEVEVNKEPKCYFELKNQQKKNQSVVEQNMQQLEQQIQIQINHQQVIEYSEMQLGNLNNIFVLSNGKE
ncbi:Hypothetical_protein [Hexamita inflata]|uniref:Hypothetical_protein n=1 Tax=Hexamita inflata TaxID=28002 RepID=A0AA86PN90_9EUKA|nr:Hypothetical protein HINF_LOCUS30769 [Hexamita inflata]